MNTGNRVRRIAGGGALLAALYVAACAYMWDTQLEHVFVPEPQLQTTPDRLGMKFDELRIPVGHGADQGELYAWWIPAGRQLRQGAGEAASHPASRADDTRQAAVDAPTLLYLHGNYRNISNNLEHTLRLHNLGYNVLLADYRGFGKSSGGKPNEAKVYEDAEAAWQYLLKQRGVMPQRAFIYGHSLGGAVAIELAVHHPEAAGLIAESTFTSMQAMGELEYGFLPVRWLLNQRFESLQKMPALKIPLLLIHGTWDTRTPVRMAQQLYAAAPQPKAIALIEGGEHNNSGAVGWTEYRAAVSAFVQRYAH